ncbi:MAG: MFS transporter [SAR202 cluster bacterium]|nr:MFS transporter [SAR202 cluster bacterium]
MKQSGTNTNNAQNGDKIYTKSLIYSVYVSGFIIQLGLGMLVPILPTFISDLEVGIALVGLGVSGILIGNTIFDIPSGLLVGRYGHKKVMLSATIVLATTSILTGFVNDFALFFLLRILSGCAVSMWHISRMSYLSNLIPNQQRGKALATFGGVHRIGLFVGPILGGLIGAHISLGSVFIIQGILTTLLLILLIPEKWNQTSNVDFSQINEKSISMKTILYENRSTIAKGSVAIISLGLVRQGRQLILPLWGAHLGMSVDEIGYVIGAASGVDMIMFLPVGYVLDKWGRKWMAVPSCMLVAIGLFLIPISDNLWTFSAIAIFTGFANGLGSGAMMTLGADLAPPKYSGEFLGIWKLLGDTSSSAAPILIGQIAGIFTLGLSSAFIGFIGVLGSLGIYIFVPETLIKNKDSSVQSK